jgi:hypothetical protein
MPFIVRCLPARPKLSREHALQVVAAAISQPCLQAVVSDLGLTEQRCRKLPALLTLLLPVALHLFPREAFPRVLARLLQGLRFLWPDASLVPASGSAICQARYRLGVRPIAELYHRCAHLLATPDTPGAFRFGLRLMALDGTLENVPDTPANRRYFGGPSNQHGAGSFPQVRALYLIECATHAIIDAGFWPSHVGERTGARRLLRSVGPSMLLLWDQGLHSAAMVQAVLACGAQVLGRAPLALRLPVEQRLADGSYLTHLSTGKDWQRQRQPGPPVRVVEYTLTDPNRPGYGVRHRLLTTLLDPAQAPAIEVVLAYHERWEVELVIDELDTDQRDHWQPLRSQKPVGVLQELYGLVLAHFAIRQVMTEAAAEVGWDPRRLSFIHAARLVSAAVLEFQLVGEGQRPQLAARLRADLRRHRLPERAERLNPRVVKRKAVRYPPLRPHHRPWPQPTIPFRDAILLLN